MLDSVLRPLGVCLLLSACASGSGDGEPLTEEDWIAEYRMKYCEEGEKCNASFGSEHCGTLEEWEADTSESYDGCVWLAERAEICLDDFWGCMTIGADLWVQPPESCYEVWACQAGTY